VHSKQEVSRAEKGSVSPTRPETAKGPPETSCINKRARACGIPVSRRRRQGFGRGTRILTWPARRSAILNILVFGIRLSVLRKVLKIVPPQSIVTIASSFTACPPQVGHRPVTPLPESPRHSQLLTRTDKLHGTMLRRMAHPRSNFPPCTPDSTCDISTSIVLLRRLERLKRGGFLVSGVTGCDPLPLEGVGHSAAAPFALTGDTLLLPATFGAVNGGRARRSICGRRDRTPATGAPLPLAAWCTESAPDSGAPGKTPGVWCIAFLLITGQRPTAGP